MYFERTNLSRVDLHVWACLEDGGDIDLFAGRASRQQRQKGRRRRQRSFGALSNHSPKVWERTFQATQHVTEYSSRL